MTEKDWAKMDYDYNKTRKKLIRGLRKLYKELQLFSTVTGVEADAVLSLIDYIENRQECALLRWEIIKKEGETE